MIVRFYEPTKTRIGVFVFQISISLFMQSVGYQGTWLNAKGFGREFKMKATIYIKFLADQNLSKPSQAQNKEDSKHMKGKNKTKVKIHKKIVETIIS